MDQVQVQGKVQGQGMDQVQETVQVQGRGQVQETVQGLEAAEAGMAKLRRLQVPAAVGKRAVRRSRSRIRLLEPDDT